MLIALNAKHLGLRIVNNFFKRLFVAFCFLSFALYITACAVGTREAAANKAKRVQPKDRRDNHSSPRPAIPSAASSRSFVEPVKPLPPYRLTFGDVIEIRFFGNPEFNVTTGIRPDGRIALEKVGELFVIGTTPEELTALVTEKFARFIKNPEVTVLVREFGKRNFFVLGEVRSPGVYQIEPGMTVLRAIIGAGGYVSGAKLNSVIMMRGDYFEQPQAFRINLENVPSKLSRESDPLVEPNDIIYVPRTFIGDLAAFTKQFFSFLTPPLDVLFRAYFLLDRTR